MTEWKKYEGTDEQIAETMSAEHGFIFQYGYPTTYKDNQSGIVSVSYSPTKLKLLLDTRKVTHYLICNPHPLADMIIRQAQTGQPVWIKQDMYQPVYGHYLESWSDGKNFIFKTIKPDWNIPGAEYSFTPFED